MHKNNKNQDVAGKCNMYLTITGTLSTQYSYVFYEYNKNGHGRFSLCHVLVKREHTVIDLPRIPVCP